MKNKSIFMEFLATENSRHPGHTYCDVTPPSLTTSWRLGRETKKRKYESQWMLRPCIDRNLYYSVAYFETINYSTPCQVWMMIINYIVVLFFALDRR